MATSASSATARAGTSGRGALLEPRQALLIRIAGGAAILAGALVFAGIFPTYHVGGESIAQDSTELISFYTTVSVGLAAFGLLLFFGGARARMMGATALLFTALVLLPEIVVEIDTIVDDTGPHPDIGVLLQQLGFLLMVTAAVVAAVALLRPLLASHEWTLRGRTLVACAAGLTGFVTAVGYGMNSVADRTGSFGSPIDPTLTRQLWVQLLVITVVAIAPLLAVATRQWTVTIGIGIGFFVFFLAWQLDNFLFAYIDNHPHLKPVEGMWTFLGAGIATLLVLGWSVFVVRRIPTGAASARRVTPRSELLVKIAGVTAVLAALGALVTEFPGFHRGHSLNSISYAPETLHSTVFAAGIAVAAALLLRANKRRIGLWALEVIALLFVWELANEIEFLTEPHGPQPGFGFWLYISSYALLLIAVAVGFIALRRVGSRVTRPQEPRWALASAVFLAFATATGFGMNPGASGGSFSSSIGSPLFLSPRSLWSPLLVIVMITVLAWIAMSADRRVGVGIWIGLATFVLGEGLLRVAVPYADNNPGAAEGTWTFIAAGSALLIFLGWRLLLAEQANPTSRA